jgi:hypothetical protein
MAPRAAHARKTPVHQTRAALVMVEAVEFYAESVPQEAQAVMPLWKRT